MVDNGKLWHEQSYALGRQVWRQNANMGDLGMRRTEAERVWWF